MTWTLYSIECSKQNTSQIAQSLKQNHPRAHMLGRASLRSRHLIGRGARWRVVDRQTIKIFHDAWLPTDVGRITTP